MAQSGGGVLVLRGPGNTEFPPGFDGKKAKVGAYRALLTPEETPGLTKHSFLPLFNRIFFSYLVHKAYNNQDNYMGIQLSDRARAHHKLWISTSKLQTARWLSR